MLPYKHSLKLLVNIVQGELGKTARKIKCKKMLMVCPYFVKYMRLRTEILCYFISTWIIFRRFVD